MNGDVTMETDGQGNIMHATQSVDTVRLSFAITDQQNPKTSKMSFPDQKNNLDWSITGTWLTDI